MLNSKILKSKKIILAIKSKKKTLMTNLMLANKKRRMKCNEIRYSRTKNVPQSAKFELVTRNLNGPRSERQKKSAKMSKARIPKMFAFYNYHPSPRAGVSPILMGHH